MSQLFMLAICIVLGYLVAQVAGALVGVLVGIAALAAWYRLNDRSGSTGLFKANLRAYFGFRLPS